jgi:cytochrome P450
MMRLSLGVLFKVCLNNGGSNNNITGTLTGNIAACHWHLSVVLGAISRSVTTAQRSNEEDVITSTKALGALLTELVETRRASPNNNLQGDLLSPILAPADHRGLSDDEAMGNSFLFMFAGHETTANPLIYIIHLLAIFPAWQDWAAAEIDQIICLSENGEVPQYGTSFPHLKRLRVILV